MLQKSSMQKVLGVFFHFPTKEHTLKDVSSYIKIAHTSVKQNLQNLVKIGLIRQRIEKRGKRNFPTYKANRDSKLFIQYKKMYNLQLIMGSGVIPYMEEKLMPKC